MALNTIFSLVFCCAALSAAERMEALEPHMGTMFRIVLYADDAAGAHAAIRSAFHRVAELDDKLSDYKPESELNRACHDAVGHNVPISADLYLVLQKSQALAELTEGAFDVSVGPVVRLWRKARQTKQVPSAPALDSALRVTGYRKVHLEQGTLRLDATQMQLDLGAIAKGYAADEALQVLRQSGYAKALVAASGDIAIGDAPPGKAGWEIGIDTLSSAKEPFTRTVMLHNTAVSTSGDTEQYVEINGVRYSHIVNPKTGKGLTHQIGVTVVADKAIDSDSLATAASVVTELRGAAEALALIESCDARGVIVTANSGRLTEFESKAGIR